MQEKDIREKLNQELEEMAPDMLSKILSTPIEPVQNEKELFGKDRPLFKEEKNWKQYLKVPAIATVAACFVALIIILYPLLGIGIHEQQQVAFSIVIDVNPSISIDVNEDGSIHKIRAVNKDAKKIVKYVNSELKDEDDYKTAMKLVVKNLKTEGYLKKKKNAMLVSAIPVEKDNDVSKELKAVKRETKDVLEAKHIECKTVYQSVELDDKVQKVAEKNNVSVGKAALCMKLAKEEKVSVKKMCKKNIDNLIKKIEKTDNSIVDSIVDVKPKIEQETDAEILDDESETMETENYEEMSTETYESESVSETIEDPAETTAGLDETFVQNTVNVN